jgi:hypothetical protein
MRFMAKRPYQDKLHIDMPFGEAVERLIGVKPALCDYATDGNRTMFD